MRKIKLVIGPRSFFDKQITMPDLIALETYVTFYDQTNHNVIEAADEDKFRQKLSGKTLYGTSESFAAITQSGIETLSESLRLAVEFAENIVLQNPPRVVVHQLMASYPDKTEVLKNKSLEISKDDIKEFYEKFPENVYSQRNALQTLFTVLTEYQHRSNHHIPLVLMFYGPSGVGKTEAANLLGEMLSGTLSRQQLSMFQNQSAADYLFGAEHSQRSFARDLANRESNVILLDEFDKVSSGFYNAFYQLFDEGVFEDRNYHVETENLIIICTANFENIEQIRQTLGDAMFYRFDAFIEFTSLNSDAFNRIVHDVVTEIWGELSQAEQSIFKTKSDLVNLFKQDIPYFQNYRHAKKLMRQFVYERVALHSL